ALFLHGSGTLTLQPGVGETLTITGSIDDESGVVGLDGFTPPGSPTLGAFNVVLSGGGTLLLEGDNHTANSTIVDGGTLRVDGSLLSATFVNVGGTLAGTGTVGEIFINGGTLAPGASPGVLHASSLEFDSVGGGTLDIELGGAAAGQFDQLVVNGGVNL